MRARLIREIMPAMLRRSLVACSTALLVACAACASHPLPPHEAAALVAPPPDERALEALGGLALTSEQHHAVQELRAKLGGELVAASEARGKLVDAVADALVAGTVEHERLDPLVDALVAACDRVKPHVLEALDTLHAILGPSERAALVGGLEKSRDDGEEEAKARVRRFLDALDLGLGQQIHIARELKARLGAEKAEADALKSDLAAAAEAFEAETFAAESLSLAKRPVIAHWLGVSITMLEVFVEALDDEQRQTLAAMARRMLGGDVSAKPSPAPVAGGAASSAP